MFLVYNAAWFADLILAGSAALHCLLVALVALVAFGCGHRDGFETLGVNVWAGHVDVCLGR